MAVLVLDWPRGSILSEQGYQIFLFLSYISAGASSATKPPSNFSALNAVVHEI